MPQDFEQLLKDLFGEPLSRLSDFQSAQMQKVMTKLQEIAREAVREELTRMQNEVTDLRSRVAKLESERAEQAAESLEPSF
jgi:polyhydroxyalkanoate synthesis regulator phasin